MRISDWSSDVCSSDLGDPGHDPARPVTEAAPRLSAQRVSKLYPGVQALDGVDFEVHAGAVNVLIGENGAGKSTLMKIIAGVEQPSAGRLLLYGEAAHFPDHPSADRAGGGMGVRGLDLVPHFYMPTYCSTL